MDITKEQALQDLTSNYLKKKVKLLNKNIVVGYYATMDILNGLVWCPLTRIMKK
jgi:hypothetical protein